MHNKNLESGETVRTDIGAAENYGGRNEILLVDDEISILKTLTWIFDGMGFEITAAGNGFDALKKFSRKPFDLVVTDLNMKGMDGLELIRKIKQRSPEIPVILLTGEEPGSVKKRVHGSDVDLILFKPFKIEEIENAVTQVITDKKGSAPVSNITYQ